MELKKEETYINIKKIINNKIKKQNSQRKLQKIKANLKIQKKNIYIYNNTKNKTKITIISYF